MDDFTPYAERDRTFQGVLDRQGHHLKEYAIHSGPETLDRSSFEAGIELVLRELPPPSLADGRPGLGFMIAHRGCGADYVVLGWWDRENELPVRVVVRDGERWRPARPSESFCVWDLDVIAHERDAYVETVLAGPGESGADGYLERPAPDMDPV